MRPCKNLGWRLESQFFIGLSPAEMWLSNGYRRMILGTCSADSMQKRQQYAADALVTSECGNCYLCRSANTSFPVESNIRIANRALVD